MPGERNYYDYLPYVDRPKLHWPGDEDRVLARPEH